MVYYCVYGLLLRLWAATTTMGCYYDYGLLLDLWAFTRFLLSKLPQKSLSDFFPLSSFLFKSFFCLSSSPLSSSEDR